jgi:hypothetical protein
MKGEIMKTARKSEMDGLVERTLEFLSSRDGKVALNQAKTRAKATVAPFRKAREVQPERLHRRFTV